MAYMRPGTQVEQVLVPTIRAVPSFQDFTPGIIGVATYVVEGTDAYAGLIASEDYDSSQVLDLPGFTTAHLPIASTVKVYVATEGAALNMKHLTREWFRSRGEAEPGQRILDGGTPYYELSADALDLADLSEGKVGVTLVTGAELNATAGNSATFLEKEESTWYPAKVKVYIEYASIILANYTATETFTLEAAQKVVSLAHYPVSSVTSVTIDTGEDAEVLEANDATDGYTINSVTGVITLGSAVTVEASVPLEVVYSYQNPVFSGPIPVSTKEEIEEYAGPVHPYNPLGFGAYQALLKAGSGPVYIMATAPSANDLDHIFDPASLTAALTEFGKIYLYCLAVMADVGSVSATLMSHITTFSAPTESKFRVAMLGFKDFDSATEKYATGTAATVVTDYLRTMYAYDDKRLRILMNPEIYIRYNGIVYPVPGIYYTAIYAGLLKTLSRSPSTPLTKYTEGSVYGVRYPGSKPNYFTESQLDTLVAAGLWVLEETPTVVRVRHQMTTAESYLETREDSIVRGMDWVSMALKVTLDGMIVGQNITPQFLEAVNLACQAIITRGIRDRVCGEKTALVSITVPEQEPDTVEVMIDYQPLYPANVIRVTVQASATQV